MPYGLIIARILERNCKVWWKYNRYKKPAFSLSNFFSISNSFFKRTTLKNCIIRNFFLKVYLFLLTHRIIPT